MVYSINSGERCYIRILSGSRLYLTSFCSDVGSVVITRPTFQKRHMQSVVDALLDEESGGMIGRELIYLPCFGSGQFK